MDLKRKRVGVYGKVTSGSEQQLVWATAKTANYLFAQKCR